MAATGVPASPASLGYGPGDVAALTRGAMLQKRLVDNAPVAVDSAQVQSLFAASLGEG
jgi:hypothetical protein